MGLFSPMIIILFSQTQLSNVLARTVIALSTRPVLQVVPGHVKTSVKPILPVVP